MDIMEEACSVCVANVTRNIRRCNAVMFNTTSQRNCLFIAPTNPLPPSSEEHELCSSLAVDVQDI